MDGYGWDGMGDITIAVYWIFWDPTTTPTWIQSAAFTFYAVGLDFMMDGWIRYPGITFLFCGFWGMCGNKNNV